MTCAHPQIRLLRLGALAALAVLFLPRPAESAAPTAYPATSRARALASQPSLQRVEPPTYDGKKQARAEAARAAEHIPLPSGGSFAGIQWEAAGGLFSAAEIETILEYNAFCKWLIAVRYETDPAGPDVLDEVPQWPGFRDQPELATVKTIVAEARMGRGSELDAALADCQLAERRQAVYASANRLQAAG